MKHFYRCSDGRYTIFTYSVWYLEFKWSFTVTFLKIDWHFAPTNRYLLKKAKSVICLTSDQKCHLPGLRPKVSSAGCRILTSDGRRTLSSDGPRTLSFDGPLTLGGFHLAGDAINSEKVVWNSYTKNKSLFLRRKNLWFTLKLHRKLEFPRKYFYFSCRNSFVGRNRPRICFNKNCLDYTRILQFMNIIN